MFAALYGDLVSYPWCDHSDTSHPLFLFDHRSNDMGWSDNLHDSSGMWEIFEAGPEHGTGEDLSNPSPAFWFYAGVDAVPDGRSLPIWPFLRCAGDVADRVGRLDLRAVQVMLPIQKLHQRLGKGLIPTLQNYGWFIASDPSVRARVRVTLASGQDPSILSAAPELLESIQSFDQPVFVCDSYIGEDPLAPKFQFGDQFWQSPLLSRAVLNGTLTEWSLDALGWLAAFLSDVAADLGVTTPLLVTVTRLS